MEVSECLRNESFSFTDIVLVEATERNCCWQEFSWSLFIGFFSLHEFIFFILKLSAINIIPAKILLGLGEVTSLIPSEAFHSLGMTSSTCPQILQSPTLSCWINLSLIQAWFFMTQIFSWQAPTLQLFQDMSYRDIRTGPTITRYILRLLRSGCSTYQTILVRNPTHTATTNVSGTMSIRYGMKYDDNGNGAFYIQQHVLV